jgi:exosortase A
MATPEQVALQGRGQSILERWKMRLLVAACLTAVLCMYWPTAWALSELWLDTTKTTYTHGWLILGITFWLILRDDRFERIAWSPNLWAVGAYCVCSLAWLVAYRAGMESAHEFVAPFLIWLALASVLGTQAAALASFPIFFVLFAVPIWDVLSPYLQSASAVMVGHMLHVSGINAYVDGNFVHIPAGVFEIAGGCSGIHFVMVGLALGALYGELARDSIRTRVLLCACALLLALVANWVRIYVIVVAGHLTNMQHYLVRVEHYRFGWVVFAVTMALFFFIASRLESSPRMALGVARAVPLVKSRYAIVALGLMVVPAWNVLVPAPTAPKPTDSDMRPTSLDRWRGTDRTDYLSWTPMFVGADEESVATFADDDSNRVEVYVAAYRSQAQGKELVGYHNRLLSDADDVVDARSAASGARELVVERGEHRDLLRFWYDIGGLKTASGFKAQLAYGVKTLWTAPLSRMIALRTSCLPDCDVASSRLDVFEGATTVR